MTATRASSSHTPLPPTTMLVVGGCRSGKSRFAEQWVNERFDRKIYLATLEDRGDAEMTARIAAHRRQRGEGWLTIEEPLRLAETLVENDTRTDVFLVDCLTMWLTNCILAGYSDPEIRTRLDGVCGALATGSAAVVLVANEVGLGLVPESPLGRRFRDLAGWVNQRLAGRCEQVVFMAAGLPLYLKGGQPQGEER